MKIKLQKKVITRAERLAGELTVKYTVSSPAQKVVCVFTAGLVEPITMEGENHGGWTK